MGFGGDSKPPGDKIDKKTPTKKGDLKNPPI